MTHRFLKRLVLWGMVAGLFGPMPGCGRPGADATRDTNSQAFQDATGQSDAAHSADHSGWWCVEHGVPEKDCTLCSAQAAARFREQGDWCEEHNRAESQCFICDPARAEKFIKLYEAKFGQKPPAPTE
ncbi:MAG: hypothetical protein KatS3mg110_1192 [Pirellulaceae bacterium]|nr:MAG: hypothetical protein KatS3mg110_1192 [Pirellulaceae bacterium]